MIHIIFTKWFGLHDCVNLLCSTENSDWRCVHAWVFDTDACSDIQSFPFQIIIGLYVSESRLCQCIIGVKLLLLVCTNKFSVLLKKFWIPSLFAGVIFISMTKQYSLDQIPNMLMIDAWRLPYTTVFSTVLDRGILVLDLQKYTCTIITPEIGAYMLFVQVWNPRWLSFHLDKQED